MRGWRGMLGAAMAGLALLAAAPAVAAGFATPEAAVTEYLEAVAARDFDRAMAATTVPQMRDGFDFVAYVDRLGALVPSMPAPSGDPFYAAINEAQFTQGIGNQMRFLAYGLLTTSELLDGKVVKMDGAAAAEFAAAVDPSRLAGLTIEKIGSPSPSLMNGERYVANAKRMAATFGADEATERVALVVLDGAHFAVGFMLMRYGDGWGIHAQYSPIAGMSALGTPMPATPDEFEELISK